MPRNDDFLSRPAPESEDDLEVPGQPFLGLLGILSEYYKYKEPNHKQGRALGNALKYLYRIKKREENGMIDENFGIEIMNAVQEVMKSNPKPAPSQPIATTSEPTSSSQPSSSSPVKPTPQTEKPKNDDNDMFSDFEDFGFSSSGGSGDALGSKIDSLVRMVKSTVKKKKKKKKHRQEEEPTAEPIPKLRIRFNKRSGSDDGSTADEVDKSETTPMKLKIKLGSPSLTSTPLLPPPPLLTLHKPHSIPYNLSPAPPALSSAPSPLPTSPKYEPEHKTIIKLKMEEDKPPIKLTLRVQQPMRSAKGWISPRTEQIVNYIDNVTTFVNESEPVIITCNQLPMKDEEAISKVETTLPEPPKLKLAPSTVCRKRKRESSPKHDTPKLTPTAIPENSKPTPIKITKMSNSSNTFKQRVGGGLENKRIYWECGIFSNTLKQDPNAKANHDQLDFRSNILPIYCGINYLRKQSDFALPYDICWLKEHNSLPPQINPSRQATADLSKLLRQNKSVLPKLLKCKYVFDQHIDEVKPKGKRGRKKKKKNAPVLASPQALSPAPSASPSCGSPQGLVIESDCDSPLARPDSVETTIISPLEVERDPLGDGDDSPGSTVSTQQNIRHTLDQQNTNEVDDPKRDIDSVSCSNEAMSDQEISFSPDNSLLNHQSHQPIKL